MKRSETTEQIGLINWARANEEYVPELRLLHHIPNEGIRTNGPVLKAAGMKRAFRICLCRFRAVAFMVCISK